MLPLNTVVKFYTSFKIGEKGVYMSEPYQKGTFFTLCDFDFMFTGLCLLLMSEMFFFRLTGFRISPCGRDTVCWNRAWIRNIPNRQTSASFITERPKTYAKKSTRMASTEASVGETVRLRSSFAQLTQNCLFFFFY